ncbi:hypothetical protein PIB30_046864 [Stylosanthes scabra]|uniref:Uncharacterized protein n=1 Tax=Stylosanthes scabra TaxID=79078 RepID=A0ABU6YHM3_9FABA|nr:hypothetical protein [Stylosanthes scabra]
MPSPAARTNIPTSSNVSSPEPSRKELMRALRHRVSSPEVSEHQRQAASDEEQSAGTRADTEDEDDSDEGDSDEDSSEE